MLEESNTNFASRLTGFILKQGVNMKKEQLNDELTIIGLILVLLFIAYYSITYISKVNQLNNKVIEAQLATILLDKHLTKIEFELEDTNSRLTILQKQRDEEDLVVQILKDIATSWNSGRKD